MVDWKTKLTSRKFWAAICNFAGMLILFFNGTQETATQVTALLMAGAGVVAFIIGEGLADAAGAANAVVMPDEVEFKVYENNENGNEEDDLK